MITQYPISATNPLTISPPSFFALGDSYSAGIGASCGWLLDEFDTTGSCLRCNGSYPHQIANLTGLPEIEVYHLACTGALMNDIAHPDPNNRTSQIDFMRSKPAGEWATLTIGGNDVGFGSVVENCIAFNSATCDASLNATDEAIADPRFMERLAKTYLAVLEAGEPSTFKLIVPGYAQFFNADTKECDKHYLWYGRYLTQELRARVNKMVANLNVVIQVAVAIVQMQLVFSNSRKGIWYEDWDGMFEGNRFCEEKPRVWSDSWFFTIQGADVLPNGTVVFGGNGPGGVKTVSCDRDGDGEGKRDLDKRIACDMASGKSTEEGMDVKTIAYPWWAMKTMHPKSVAHFAMGRRIYEKWMHGEYF